MSGIILDHRPSDLMRYVHDGRLDVHQLENEICRQQLFCLPAVSPTVCLAARLFVQPGGFFLREAFKSFLMAVDHYTPIDHRPFVSLGLLPEIAAIILLYHTVATESHPLQVYFYHFHTTIR